MDLFFMPTIQIAKSAINTVTVGPKRLQINDHPPFLEKESAKAAHALRACGFYSAPQQETVLDILGFAPQKIAPDEIVNDHLDIYDYPSDAHRQAAFTECMAVNTIDSHAVHRIAKKYASPSSPSAHSHNQ